MAGTFQGALEQMIRRMDQMGPQLKGGFPHFADAKSEWRTTPDGDWTGGFWPGMCWLAAKATGSARYRRWALEWAERLRPRAASDTAFRGFLFYYGGVLGAVLFNDPTARELALEGARQWATTYNPNARCFPLGDAAEEASDVGRGEASVDTVQGAALLVWASQAASEPAWRNFAVSHARRHIELCIRADGSVCQSASFDPTTGTMLRRYTHKGFSNESTWARAQAWAILGYAEQLEFVETLKADAVQSALEPTRPDPRLEISRRFLRAATATSDFYLANSCADGVPIWDTAAPNLHRLGDYLNRPSDPYNQWEPMDSSAAAIAAQRAGRFRPTTR